MKSSAFFILCVSLFLSGCTILGMAVDKKFNDFENRDKSVLDAKTYDHSGMEAGFEADKRIVKTVLESTGKEDVDSIGGDRNVPVQCQPPLTQVCSAKENVCICSKPYVPN